MMSEQLICLIECIPQYIYELVPVCGSHLSQILTMEFITSIRGGRKLVYEGYIYVKQKDLARGVVSYECEMRKRGAGNSSQCKARVKVRNEQVIDITNEHTHEQVHGRPETLRVRNNMKQRAVDTMEAPQQILGHCLQHVSEAAATQLPPFRTMRRTLRRTKQQTNDPLPIPPSVDDLDIPEKYQRTTNNEQFLLYDNRDDDGAPRMLVYATPHNLRLLARSRHWFMDGTFKIVPQHFQQLYTIHVLHDSQIIPCVYALLPNKTELTYRAMFQALSDAQDNLQPETVLIDYEIAALNAFGAIFPDTEVKGCLFHLTQCVHRRVQDAGLQVQYREDETLSLATRMIPAIAFVHPDDVVESFELLQDEIPEELQPIMDYFEDTFIGRPGRRRRRGPTFPPAIWNVYSRVEAGLPRTNNNIEGWHRRMDASAGCHHPNIWVFLDILKKEEALNRITVIQTLAGQGPPPQRRTYRNITQRLQTLVGDYENRGRLDFLRGVAHNLHV